MPLWQLIPTALANWIDYRAREIVIVLLVGLFAAMVGNTVLDGIIGLVQGVRAVAPEPAAHAKQDTTIADFMARSHFQQAEAQGRHSAERRPFQDTHLMATVPARRTAA